MSRGVILKKEDDLTNPERLIHSVEE